MASKRVPLLQLRMTLTHINELTGAAQMVDVSSKTHTERTARAQAVVQLRPETMALIQANSLAKGDALAVARVAGIMAAKRTDELIPLCHSLPVSQVLVDFEMDTAASTITVFAQAKTVAGTGVEMEALTAASVAALTLYDMAKSSDKAITITDIRLLEKTGGKSGDYKWKAQ
jgi:cyclic pyranopterin phosphate synthase